MPIAQVKKKVPDYYRIRGEVLIWESIPSRNSFDKLARSSMALEAGKAGKAGEILKTSLSKLQNHNSKKK